MKLDANPVEKYEFGPGDKLFLDANIWLYIHSPQPPWNQEAAIYSEALWRMLDAQSQIFIDVLVVSEFINAYARKKWKLVAPDIEHFKIFRKSSAFNPVAKEIADNAKRVLDHCSRLESRFEVLSISGLLDDYAKGDSDFNDQVITELCKLKGLKLITHDSDFRGQGITILTANTRLLV